MKSTYDGGRTKLRVVFLRWFSHTHLVMPDSPDEADDRDSEEEDATGSDPSNYRERLNLIGSLAVGCNSDQDEAHQLRRGLHLVHRLLCTPTARST